MRWRAGVGLALALGACAPIAPLPVAPLSYGAAITVRATPVPLDPADPTRRAIGRFVYAGGLHLTSSDTARLHGMSDMKVTANGQLTAVGDQADLFEARIVLDDRGRLTGLTDAKISALKDADGAELYPKGQFQFDTEGVARLADGRMLVTLEQNDRVLLYPAQGGAPKLAPRPQIAFTHNSGMESVATDPAVAADAYRVGIEETGDIFLCRLSTACAPLTRIDLAGMKLVAMEVLADGRTLYLLRDFSPATGAYNRLRIVDRSGRTLDEMLLARPLTHENLEGLGAVPGAYGAIRFYLISDDNFGTYAGLPTGQKTLLLAFDWTP